MVLYKWHRLASRAALGDKKIYVEAVMTQPRYDQYDPLLHNITKKKFYNISEYCNYCITISTKS